MTKAVLAERPKRVDDHLRCHLDLPIVRHVATGATLMTKRLEYIRVLPFNAWITSGYKSMCLDCPWGPFTNALAAPLPRS